MSERVNNAGGSGVGGVQRGTGVFLQQPEFANCLISIETRMVAMADFFVVFSNEPLVAKKVRFSWRPMPLINW